MLKSVKLALFISILLFLSGCNLCAEYQIQITQQGYTIEAQQVKIEAQQNLLNETIVKSQEEVEKYKKLYDEGMARNFALKPFPNVAILEVFLNGDQTDKNKFIEDTFDCDDFAYMLIENANKKGYLMYPYLDTEKKHMSCIAPVDDFLHGVSYYSIEPQTDIKKWIGYKD